MQAVILTKLHFHMEDPVQKPDILSIHRLKYGCLRHFITNFMKKRLWKPRHLEKREMLLKGMREEFGLILKLMIQMAHP